MANNPLNNFSFSEGVDILSQKIKTPFNRFLSGDQVKDELRKAYGRNDFKGGFVIRPHNKNGEEISENVIAFLNDSMPKVPFKFGGEQRFAKDYYPGSSEPTVQVLGSQESDLTITGRLKAKRIRPNGPDTVEDWRQYPLFIQEQIEAIRVAGLLVKLELGTWVRWAFIQNANFELKTLADIEYNITFLVVGFNKPTDHIIADNIKTLPTNKNKETAAAAAAAYSAVYGQAPATLPKSFADQINSAISDVAAATNLVTSFVDTVLGEADSLKASVARALGLVKNARASISQYKRKVGIFDPQGGVSKSTRIDAAYLNATYVASTYTQVNTVNAALAALARDLKAITSTAPSKRHSVKSGDTLHTIAMKYYKDSSKWESIYDHNKLISTELTVGTILEIPRI